MSVETYPAQHVNATKISRTFRVTSHIVRIRPRTPPSAHPCSIRSSLTLAQYARRTQPPDVPALSTKTPARPAPSFGIRERPQNYPRSMKRGAAKGFPEAPRDRLPPGPVSARPAPCGSSRPAAHTPASCVVCRRFSDTWHCRQRIQR